MTEFITDGFTKRQSTGAIFLNISKAFDKVWHSDLVHKMIEAGVNTKLIQLIQSFLKHRKCKIKVEDAVSDEVNLEAGVPQGAVLSPTLYSIYTNDIPKNRLTQIALYYTYADDTAIYTKAKSHNIISERLKSYMEELEEWQKRWKIRTNPDKTDAILFSKRRKAPGPRILHKEQEIPWKNSIKYLGVTMDRRLTWKSHIQEKANQAAGKFEQLRPLLGARSKLSLKNKVRIYKAIISPTMTYAAAAWCFAAPTNLKKLETTQNKILRRMTEAPWYIRNVDIAEDLNIRPITETIKDLARKTY